MSRTGAVSAALRNQGPYSDVIGLGARVIGDTVGARNGGRPYYWSQGRAYSRFLDLPGSGFTRASTATDVVNGALTTYASGQPRENINGFLIEFARTNLITNGQGAGGGGATFPTNWNHAQAWGGSVVPSEWASGTDVQGYGYAQFRINGSGIASNRLLLSPASARTPVTAGLIYSLSHSAQIMAGSYAGRLQFIISWRDASDVQISASSGVIRTANGTLQRWGDDTFTAPALATQAVMYWDFLDIGTVGAATDFTMRLGGVMFEASSYTTSYVPTTNGAATRASDYPFIDMILDAPFSLRAKWVQSARIIARGGQATTLSAARGTGNNADIANLNTFVAAQSNSNAASAVVTPQLTAVGPAVATARFADNDTAASVNGGTPVVDNTGLITTGLTRLALGQRSNLAGSFELGGYLMDFAVAGPMSNAQLQTWGMK